MTNEMTVQQNKSYAVPGAVIGAGAGTAGAAALLKWKPEWSIQTGKVESWQDIIDANLDDTFVSKKAEKEGEVGDAWKAVQSQRDTLKKANESLDNLIPENFKTNEKVKAWKDAVVDLAKAEEEKLTELRTKYKAGEAVEGLAAGIADEALDGKIKEAAVFKNAIQGKQTAVTNALNEAKAVEGFSATFTDAVQQSVKTQADDIATKNRAATTALKDHLKNLKTPSAVWTYIAGAVGLALVGLGVGALIKSKKEA